MQIEWGPRLVALTVKRPMLIFPHGEAPRVRREVEQSKNLWLLNRVARYNLPAVMCRMAGRRIHAG